MGPGKSNQRSIMVVRTSAEVDGEKGRVGVPRGKLLQYIHFMLWALKQEKVSLKVASMVCGRFCRAFEFRRPLLGVMNPSWISGQWKHPQSHPPGMVVELLVAAALVPMAFTDLGLRSTVE